VTAALIDAAATLYAESHSSAVTVRRIAAEAGVNPAMVNRYFGSKDNLVQAVLERSQHRIAARNSNVHNLPAAVDALFRSVMAEKEFVAILARACLDDTLPPFPGGYPAMTGLIERLESQGAVSAPVITDPRILVICLASLSLGYGLYGEFLRRGTGLEAWPTDEVETAVVEVCRRLVGA